MDQPRQIISLSHFDGQENVAFTYEYNLNRQDKMSGNFELNFKDCSFVLYGPLADRKKEEFIGKFNFTDTELILHYENYTSKIEPVNDIIITIRYKLYHGKYEHLNSITTNYVLIISQKIEPFLFFSSSTNLTNFDYTFDHFETNHKGVVYFSGLEAATKDETVTGYLFNYVNLYNDLKCNDDTITYFRKITERFPDFPINIDILFNPDKLKAYLRKFLEDDQLTDLMIKITKNSDMFLLYCDKETILVGEEIYCPSIIWLESDGNKINFRYLIIEDDRIDPIEIRISENSDMVATLTRDMASLLNNDSENIREIFEYFQPLVKSAVKN